MLLETSGNQHYIFATNKLRENFGASELTRNAGEGWLMEAVKEIATHPLFNLDERATIEDQRQALLNQDSIFGDNPPLLEVIVAASGKAILITQDEAAAKQIVQSLTTKALTDAPGLDLCGAILDVGQEEIDKLQVAASDTFAKQFSALMRGVHERYAFVHAKRPGNATRFLRLPIVDVCKTSGLPAETLKKSPGEDIWQGRSAVSLAKEKARETARSRLDRLLEHENIESHGWTFPKDSQQLEQTLSNSDGENTWLAVIHADGNGLGQIFLDFAHHLDESERTLGHAFIKFREFSIELDRCTEEAFRKALLKTFGNEYQGAYLPMVPLILGGDDLTVLCDGRRALNFIANFLLAFEHTTRESDTVKAIAKKALGKDNLSACAGVAIVKPHFPFSVAYELTEALIKSAKTVKQRVQYKDNVGNLKTYPCSALDFHILYDSSNIDLDDIRDRRLTVDNGTTKLTGKPYVVSDISKEEISEKKISEDSQAWLNQHCWSQLLEKVKQMQAIEQSQDRDDTNNEPVLPRSQVYGLRQTLFSGRDAADARLSMLINRYQKLPDALWKLSKDTNAPSLFQAIEKQEETQQGDPNSVSAQQEKVQQKEEQADAKQELKENKLTHFTSYLDALEMADFVTVNRT